MGQKYRDREGMEEMRSAVEVGSTSFNDVLSFNKVSITYPSIETKKNRSGIATETINVNTRGQDVAHNTMWQKFLAHMGYIDASLISLTKDTDRLTEDLYSYIVNDYANLSKYHSDRYQNLDAEGRRWLRKVARLAVKYHLLQNKLNGLIQSFSDEEDDADYFCSTLALYLYMLVRKGVKVWVDHTMRGIQHIVKEPELKDAIIKTIMDQFYDGLRQVLYPQRDDVFNLISDLADKESTNDNEDKDDGEEGIPA